MLGGKGETKSRLGKEGKKSSFAFFIVINNKFETWEEKIGNF